MTFRIQSALLEAMEEKQVTIEGETRALPDPFFVIPTQNPHDQLGTYALPESQLDRFLMRISLVYPDRAAERALLSGQDRRDMVDTLPGLLTPAQLAELQRAVLAVHTSDALLDYVQDLIEWRHPLRHVVPAGAQSARRHRHRAGGQGAGAAGRAQLCGAGRCAVHPPHSVAHRLAPTGHAGRGAVEQVHSMLRAVPLA